MHANTPLLRRIAQATALTVTLGVGAACSDDSTSAPSAGCTSLVEFNTAASGDDNSDTSSPDAARALAATLDPLWKQASTAVPASARHDVDVVSNAITELAGGDDQAFNADATFESYANALNAAVKSCDFRTQRVRAAEAAGKYTFQGMPKTHKPGVLAVTLSNEGAEPHVMVFYRKNDGETRSAVELLALPEDEGRTAGTEAGAVFAGPGTTSVGLVTLTRGSYVYFCPVAIGGGDDGPPHFTAGMYGELTVG